MNTYKTCQGCPDRSITCHGACPGYQAREQEKAQRYRDRTLKAAGAYGYYDSAVLQKNIKEHHRLVGLGHPHL